MSKNIEKENFMKLLTFTHKYPDAIYILKDSTGNTISVKYDTDYETDNGLELDDPQYEEYYGIAFSIIQTGNLFEINYHNLPEAITCNGEKIY